MPNHFWQYRPPRNQRLDPALYQEPYPCFVTIRCYGRSAPFTNPSLAGIAVRCLLEQQAKSSCRLSVYCVMPDHVHLVITPEPGGSSLAYVERFKGWSSYLLHQASWDGKVWQPRFYDHLLRQDEDLAAVAAYILGNPVRKCLCLRPEDYPFAAIVG